MGRVKHDPGLRMSLRQGSPLTWVEASNTIHILAVLRSDLSTGRCSR